MPGPVAMVRIWVGLGAVPEHQVEEVGINRLKFYPKEQLSAGEVGYVIAGIKSVREIEIGDTITGLDRERAFYPTILVVVASCRAGATYAVGRAARGAAGRRWRLDAAWLRLRGVPALHASAVAVGGAALAVVGSAGAGKSTTAAARAARGHAVVADDVLALRALLGRDGPPIVAKIETRAAMRSTAIGKPCG